MQSSSAAEIPQPLRNQRKAMIFFVGLIFQLQRRMAATASCKTEGNGSNIYARTLCEQGRLKESLHILHLTDNHVGSSTYACLLQGCINQETLAEGKLVHTYMTVKGLKLDIHLGTVLVTMYAKCGSLADARRVLDQMLERNVVSWTVMIAAYTRHGDFEAALKLFYQMQRIGVQPNEFTFSCVLPACANLALLKEVHEEIIIRGLQSDVFVANALVDMYAKCGNIENARQVFDNLHQRDVVSWNTMIAGYVQNGHVEEALELFKKMPERNVVSWTTMIAGYAQTRHAEEALELLRQMQPAGIEPTSKTIASVLPACANLSALEQGMEIHGTIIRSGFQSDVIVGNALIYMYAKCGKIEKARSLFDKMHQRSDISWTALVAGYAYNGYVDEALKLFQNMPERNVVSWTAMIAGYAQNGHGEEALNFFSQMQLAGVKPNSKTFASVLPACANLEALKHGMEIHEEIIRSGYQSDAFVVNALVDMYAKCGNLESARDLFDNMCQRDVVSWNALIAGYAQHGHVEEALKLFQKIPERNVVSWTAMIAAYVQNGRGEAALELFQQMQLAGVKPNSKTFASVLPACANLAALEQGKEIHKEIIKSGFQSDIFLGNGLVDMYAKCGSIEIARNMFDKMPRQDVVSWTVMISGYAMHGFGKEALKLFEQMQHAGKKPDHVTLLGVLSACCHAGLVDEGRRYFDCMEQYYHITPAMEHYGCMVDLLGRAGHLDEAHDFIIKMPVKADSSVWGCLLGACRIYNNIELGEHVAEQLFKLDPKNSLPYVLLANIYGAADRWEDIENVWKIMKDRRVKRNLGCSWIEVNKQVYTFLVGDRSHPQTQKIYAELERLSRQMKVAGYVPTTSFVLNDVEEEQKEQILCHHSEKLAIAFGLINTSPGTPIRVIKNLRVCCDCHSATKYISKIVAREIVVRDANRFHHFKDGCCSCGDYW
eukprot:Gb_38817 [translate_table: standard]